MDFVSAGMGLLSTLGSAWQVNEQEKEAQANREFQQGARATSYQTAVKDMEAAGLNPAMMYDKGGMGSGTLVGSQAQVSGENPIAQGVSSAVAAASVDKIKAETRNVEADTLGKLELPALWKQQTATGYQEMWRTLADRNRLSVEYNRVLEEVKNVKNEADRREYYNEHILPLEKRIAAADAQLRELEIPHAQNVASAESTAFKRYVSPFLKDIGSITGAASSAAGAAAAGRFLGRGIK